MCHHLIAMSAQFLGNDTHQVVLGCILQVIGSHHALCQVQCTLPCELNKALQSFHTLSAGAFQVDLLCPQRGEDDHLVASTTHGHIQSTLTALIVQRSEVHRHLSMFVRTVSHAEQDHVSLITLHVLQVLDENRLLALISPLLQLRMLGQLINQDILDEVLLHLTEAHNTNASL